MSKGGEEQSAGMTRLRDFTEDTEIHGIKRIARREYSILRKIFWLIACIGCFAGLVYQIQDRITIYFNYPYNTVIDIKFNTTVLFPSITFCNANKYRLSKLEARDLYELGQELYILNDDYQLHNPDRYTQDFIDKVNSIDFTQFESETAPFDMAEFVVRAGHNMSDMLIRCEFESEKCSPANFTQISTELGTCDVFNFDGGLTVQQAGKGNGLKVWFNLELDEYTEDSTEMGMMFAVHSPNEPVLIKRLGSAVEPGSRYFVAMRALQVHNLRQPWGDCEMNNIQLNDFDTYTIPACLIQHETDQMVEKYNCRLYFMPGNAPLCGRKGEDWYDDLKKEIVKNSTFVCDNPCTDTQFEFTLSSLKFRENESMSQITNIKRDQARMPPSSDETILFDFYFEDLNVETVVQSKAYGPISLLSDVGGNMGLLMGASILTLFHLVEFLLQEVYERCWLVSSKTKPTVQTVVRPVQPLKEVDKYGRSMDDGAYMRNMTDIDVK